MAGVSVQQSDILFQGGVTVKGALVLQGNFTPPAGSIVAASIAVAAGIEASKLQHDFRKGYAQESATNAASESRVIHVAAAAGTVQAFVAGAVALLAAPATCSIDLKKNGVSVLSAAIALAAGDSIRVAKAATISSAAYIAGDVFEIVIAAAAGGGTLPKGVFAQAQMFEVSQ